MHVCVYFEYFRFTINLSGNLIKIVIEKKNTNNKFIKRWFNNAKMAVILITY